jgi:hypothetical protein
MFISTQETVLFTT